MKCNNNKRDPTHFSRPAGKSPISAGGGINKCNRKQNVVTVFARYIAEVYSRMRCIV